MELVSETTNFCDLIEAIPKSIGSTTICFGPEFLGITGVDTSAVEVVNIFIVGDFFTDYKFKNDEKTSPNVTLRVGDLLDIVKIGSKYKSSKEISDRKKKTKKDEKDEKVIPETHIDDRVIVTTDFSSDMVFDFQKNNATMSKKLTIKFIEPEPPLPIPDETNHFYDVKMDSKEFDKLITDSRGSLLRFNLKNGMMTVESEDDSGIGCVETFIDSDFIRILSNKKDNPNDVEISVAFSRQKILNFKSPQSTTRSTYLQFHPTKALRIRYNIDNSVTNGFIEYYLAASLNVDKE
jgi:hypothetical protein